MNERIKELALESKLLVEKKPHLSKGMEELSQRVTKAVDAQLAHYYEVMGGKPELQEALVQKFAELIVAECISVVKSTVDESIDFDRKLDETSSWIEGDIKKHFGVES